MARINLETRPAFGIRYQHPSDRTGTMTRIETYSIFIQLIVAPKDAAVGWRPPVLPPERCFDALIDTGTPLTVIPHSVWQRFANDIEILADPDVNEEFFIGGGSHRARLGRMQLGAADNDRNWMNAEWTLALLLNESPPGTALPVPLLGLHSHFFAKNRRLRHTGYTEGELLLKLPEWRLEDRSRWWPW